MRVMFLSPHADDVALSLAGVASGMSADKHLVTVFSESMWVEPGWDGPTGQAEVTAVRRREDAAFCASLGFTHEVLGLPDTSVRHGRLTDLRTAHGDEERLCAEVEGAVRGRLAEGGFTVLVAPVGLGRHADHVVCARAALAAARATGVPVAFYEDVPYAAELSPAAIRWCAFRLDPALRPLLCRSEESVEEKLRRLSVYRTQMDERLLLAVVRQSRRLAGRIRPDDTGATDRVHERLWTAAPRDVLAASLQPQGGKRADSLASSPRG